MLCGLEVLAYRSSIQNVEAEDLKFEAILDYIVKSYCTKLREKKEGRSGRRVEEKIA